MSVRLATADDEDAVFQIALQAHRESGMFPPALECFVAMWQNCMAGEWICGIAGKGDPEGAIVLAPGSIWYSKETFLSEMFMYVKPEHRNSDNGRALIEFAKDMARERKQRLIIGFIDKKDLDAKTRMYRRRFGNPIGMFFCYEP